MRRDPDGLALSNTSITSRRLLMNFAHCKKTKMRASSIGSNCAARPKVKTVVPKIRDGGTKISAKSRQACGVVPSPLTLCFQDSIPWRGLSILSLGPSPRPLPSALGITRGHDASQEGRDEPGHLHDLHDRRGPALRQRPLRRAHLEGSPLGCWGLAVFYAFSTRGQGVLGPLLQGSGRFRASSSVS